MSNHDNKEAQEIIHSTHLQIIISIDTNHCIAIGPPSNFDMAKARNYTLTNVLANPIAQL
jgi:hypothetical protein